MANKSTTKTDKAERAARAAIDEAATAVSRTNGCVSDSYTPKTLPTTARFCRYRWSPDH